MFFNDVINSDNYSLFKWKSYINMHTNMSQYVKKLFLFTSTNLYRHQKGVYHIWHEMKHNTFYLLFGLQSRKYTLPCKKSWLVKIPETKTIG